MVRLTSNDQSVDGLVISKIWITLYPRWIDIAGWNLGFAGLSEVTLVCVIHGLPFPI
jgi:hypothetical protein